MSDQVNAERAGRLSARTLVLTVFFSALFLVAVAVLVVGASGGDNPVSGSDAVSNSNNVVEDDNDKDTQTEDENQTAEEDVSSSDYEYYTSIPMITVKTSKAAGSEFTFSLYSNAVCVDWGNGKREICHAEADGTVKGKLKGSTVKIYTSRYEELIMFDCSGQQVNDIDLSNCKKTLQLLFLSDNKLTSLNVSGFESITVLDCSNNNLKSLDISNMPYLMNLMIDGNESLSAKNVKLWTSDPIKIQSEVNVNDIISLSKFDYNLDDDGGCTFKWYDNSTKKEVEVASDGYCTFEFDEKLKGKSLYCEITQPTLKISVKTTVVKVVAEKLPQEGGTDFVNKTTPSDDLAVKDGDGKDVAAGDFKVVIASLADNEKDAVIAAVKKVNTAFDEKKNGYSLYDISLQSLDGEELNISKGSVRVTLAYPTGKFEDGKSYSDYNYTVYHYNSKGVAEKVRNISCEPDGISFNASSFSPYMLTWMPKTSGGSTTESPTTGENIIMTAAAIYVALFSLGMIGVTLIKIKMSRGRREDA